MKLSAAASAESTSLELLHPLAEEPTGVVVTGWTPDSKEYRKIQRSVIGKNAQSVILGKSRKDNNKIELDPRQAEQQNQVVIKSITNITGFDDWDFSPEKAEELLSNPQYTWIVDQWKEHIDDRANFFNKPAIKLRSGAKS